LRTRRRRSANSEGAKEIVRTSIVLAAGLVLIAAIVGVTLARSPATLAGTNSMQAENSIGVTVVATNVCQAGETLPAGTSAVRLSLVAIIGSRVSVRALANGKLLTEGSRGAGWTGSEVTVPVRPLARGFSHVTICFGLSELNGEVEVRGQHTYPVAVSVEGQRLHGRFRVEYVRAGHSSWGSRISSIATHIGLGRAASGEWMAFFILTLVLSVVALTSWGIVRELR
jgi:hypothetical protein